MFRSVLLLSALAACSPRAVLPDRDRGGDRLGEAELPFEALFSPHDDTMAREVEQIRAVIDAREADPATYDEGQNPYRIRYAVYNLRNDQVVWALADAEDAGVDVQVIMEKDQLDPARDYNWADEALIERGFTFALDYKDLSDDERAVTDLIGISGSGLMHLKTRLFESPEGRPLVTGSQNPGDNAVFNDENWHLIRDERIIDAYSAAYDGILYGTGLHNEWDDQAGLNVLFTPEASGPLAGTRILDWLAEEDEQILLMVYSLRDISAPGHEDSLVGILADLVAAGVPVVLITDRKQSDYYDSTEDRLRDVGVHVYEATNSTTEFTAMHHKVAVLGRTDIKVITDASNWSKSGLGSSTTRSTNVESVLFVEPRYDGGRTGRRYLDAFLRTLERYAWQSESDGEPPYEQLAAELLAQPGWPTAAVAFVADEAYTSWGETIRVVGDLPQLGHWGQDGLGQALWTDGDLYPTWMPEKHLALPIGTQFEYKLVGEMNGQLRWEAGENRAGFAQPPAFQSDELIELRGSWRW